MNKLLRSFLLIAAISGAAMPAAHAQTTSASKKAKVNPSAVRATPSSQAHRPAPSSEQVTPFLNPNSAPYAVPQGHDVEGSIFTGVAGTYDRQTNGGPLHNFQIDPSNPQRIHAAIMSTTANTPADSVGFAYPSRRVLYINSTDGGMTWSTPLALGDIRGGYANMVLARRGSSYYPVIAQHQVAEEGLTDLVVGLYVQKSDGTFSFSKSESPDDAPGSGEYIWPQIAISPDQTTVYMVASYSYPTPGTGAFPDYQPLKFGTFTLDATGGSTWNGWKGANNGSVLGDFAGRNMGYSGQYVIRTSEAGKIGLLYVNHNYAEADQGTYFVESTDQGTTWQTGGPNEEDPQPLFPALIAETESGNRSMVSDGLDFFYQGETPHFTLLMNRKIGPYDGPDSMGTYFPITSELYYYKKDADNIKIINHAFAGSFFLFDEGYPLYLSNDNRVEVEVLDSAAYLTYPDITDLYIPENGFISNPTFLRTSDPNTFGIVYETIVTDNFGELPEWSDDARILHWFNSIYYQETTDGGNTWSPGRPFRDELNTDFRFPMTSHFNNQSRVGEAKILFSADSLPGQLRGAGRAGWGWTYWYMHPGNAASVKRTGTTENLTLEQNYPNPFNPSTSVTFSVKEAAQVRLVVEDMMGRQVAVAFEGMVTPGQKQNVKIDASNLPSGVYQYVLETENESVARRMVLSK